MNSRALNGTEMNRSRGVEEVKPEAHPIKEFLSLIKIGIVNSNLITVFAGLWLALHFSNLSFLNHLAVVIFTLAGAALVIGGSCAINNYIDRDIDIIMERTKGRPTVTGRLAPLKALFLGIALVTVGLLLLLQTSIMAAVLGFIGVFSYVILYTIWTKRKFVANTIVGSISGAVPPLIGWAAIDANLSLTAWGLFLIMFVWQPPHFYSLAMRRVEEYRQAGVPMLPVVKGFETTKKRIIFWILALIPLPFLLGSIGISFIILASALNLGWLILGIYNYRKKAPKEWASSMFLYSLQYLTIMFISMVILTLF